MKFNAYPLGNHDVSIDLLLDSRRGQRGEQDEEEGWNIEEVEI
jgi:hypothetical protein